ncbi:MAG: hypothetical protein RIA69_10870 [Cyclobacteriaceae bacterium]
MKLVIFILLLAGTTVNSCRKDKAGESTPSLNQLTIKSGLTGTIKEKKGNCMPMLDPDGNATSSCKEVAIQDTLVIHELTSWDQLIGEDSYYDSIKSKRIATVISDQEGFYEVKLSEGQYSIFIVENKKYYANRGTSDGVNPVKIQADSVTVFDPVLDKAVY